MRWGCGLPKCRSVLADHRRCTHCRRGLSERAHLVELPCSDSRCCSSAALPFAAVGATFDEFRCTASTKRLRAAASCANAADCCCGPATSVLQLAETAPCVILGADCGGSLARRDACFSVRPPPASGDVAQVMYMPSSWLAMICNGAFFLIKGTTCVQPLTSHLSISRKTFQQPNILQRPTSSHMATCAGTELSIAPGCPAGKSALDVGSQGATTVCCAPRAAAGRGGDTGGHVTAAGATETLPPCPAADTATCAAAGRCAPAAPRAMTHVSR
jgi:hypothetical protein